MAQNANYLALDLGAESGRTIVGTFDGKILALQELHRFPNGPVKVGNRMYWDALRLFAEMLCKVVWLMKPIIPPIEPAVDIGLPTVRE